MRCSESYYDLIGELFAAEFDIVSFLKPLSVFEKKISRDSFVVSKSDLIKVPFKKTTAKFSENDSKEIIGAEYTSTITWDLNNPTEEEMSVLQRLNGTPHHIFMKFLGDNLAVVRAVEHGYSFSMVEKDGVLSCTITIVNSSGLQQVID